MPAIRTRLALLLPVAFLTGPSRAPAADPRPGAGPAVPWRGTGVVGVWMGMVSQRMMSPGMGSYTPEPRWRVFFADGDVFTDLPDAGLQAFDRAASKAGPRAGYWGRWTMTGNKGHAQKPGENFGTTIALVGPDKIELDGLGYLRCGDVTGLRLEGAWTSYADPKSPDLDRLPVGRRPVIHFTRAGRFTDDGLFATFLRSGGADQDRLDAPGDGTYEAADFTLVLHYADGRVRREALSGFLGADPAKTNDIITVRRSLLRRRP